MGILYNFRGVANEDLTPELALRIGNIAGSLFLSESVAVGSDHRKSSPMLKWALSAGLASVGCEITDYGILPTPVLAYLTKSRHKGGCIVTASHNPPEWNGIKLFGEDGTVFGPEEENKIKEETSNPSSYTNWRRLKECSLCDKGVDDYLRNLLDLVSFGDRKLKVVVDAGGGTASVVVPKMLRLMGFDVVELFCELDPFFRFRPSEPRPENLTTLSKVIRDEEADIGFAYDGDTDRIVVCDEKGECVPGNICMIFLADKFVRKGSRIVSNIGGYFSMRYVLGDKYCLIPEKLGQTFIQARMKKENAVFGGEPDGHYMWPGFFQSYADAIFSTAKMVEALSNEEASLSEILNSYPQVFLVRTKSKPWRGSFTKAREEIISFLECISSNIYTDLDSHTLYCEGDEYGLMIRQSHWDETVRIEIETVNQEEGKSLVREVYHRLLNPKGVEIPNLELQLSR